MTSMSYGTEDPFRGKITQFRMRSQVQGSPFRVIFLWSSLLVGQQVLDLPAIILAGQPATCPQCFATQGRLVFGEP